MLLIIALVFFFCAVQQVQSVTVQSTFINEFEANGTQGNASRWQQKSLTISCSNTAPRNPNLLIGGLSNDFKCDAPVYAFDARLVGFINHQVRRFYGEYCEVDGLIDYGSSGNAANSGGSGAGRRLLWDTPQHPQQKQLKQQPPPQPVNKGQRRLMDAYTDCIKGTPSQQEILACQQTFGTTYGCSGTTKTAVDGGSGGCPPWAASPGCTSQATCLQSWLLSDMNTLNQTALWISGQQIFNQDQATALTNLQNITKLQRDQQLLQQQATQQLNLSIEALANNTQQKYDFVQGQFANFSLAMGNQLAIDVSMSARQQLFENVTNNNFKTIADTGKQLASNVSANFFTVIGQIRGANQLSRSSDAVFNKAIKKVGTRRGLNKQIFNLVQVAENAGLKPFFDPAQPGSAPGPASVLSQTVFVDIQYLNMINGSGNTVHQYKMGYYCQVAAVVDDFLSDVTWSDLVEQIGPPGCTTRPGTTVSNCKCWIQINHDVCAANTWPNDGIARDFDWQQITTTEDITAYILRDNAAYCLGSGGASNRISTGPWDGRLIDDIRVWNAFSGQLCASYPLSLHTLGLRASGTGLRQMQLVSTRTGISNLDPPANPAQTCAPNYDYIFGITSGTAPIDHSLIPVIFFSWVHAQELLLSDQHTYETEVYGIPPNFLTYEELPFRLLNNNKSYTCHRAHFLAISDDTRPVFKITPRGVTTSISVTAHDSEPVCDNTGCVFGNVVSTESTVAAVATVPFEFLLPDGSDTIVGEWRTHGIPTMTTIFDAPKGAAPMNNVNSNRKGKLTYVWQPIPDGYNISTQTSYDDSLPYPQGPWPRSQLLDKWNAQNPVSFNAIDGQFSADFTEVAFVNGQAIVAASGVAEWAALMLTQFFINPLTDMRKGHLFLSPFSWEYVATLDIPDGEIIQRVFPGCPEITFTSYTNGFQQVSLVNSLPTVVNAVLRTTNLSPALCPSLGDQKVELQPKQTVTVNTIPCGHQLLTLYQQQVGGGLSVCSNALNVTFDPTSQANVAMFTSATTNRSIVDDTIQAQLALVGQNQLDFFSSIVPLLSVQFTPQLTVLERSNAIADAIAAQNATLRALLAAATTVNTQSATQAIAPFIQGFNALNAKFDDLSAQETAAEKKAGDSINAVAADVARQGSQTNRTLAAINYQVGVNRDYLNAASSAQTSTEQCNWCGSSFLGNLPFLCSILCSIITFLIGGGTILLIVGIVVGLVILCKCCKGGNGGGIRSWLPSLAPKQPEVVVQMPQAAAEAPPRYETAADRDRRELTPLLRLWPDVVAENERAVPSIPPQRMYGKGGAVTDAQKAPARQNENKRQAPPPPPTVSMGEADRRRLREEAGRQMDIDAQSQRWNQLAQSGRQGTAPTSLSQAQALDAQSERWTELARSDRKEGKRSDVPNLFRDTTGSETDSDLNQNDEGQPPPPI